jgi:hypothetical protein
MSKHKKFIVIGLVLFLAAIFLSGYLFRNSKNSLDTAQKIKPAVNNNSGNLSANEPAIATETVSFIISSQKLAVPFEENKSVFDFMKDFRAKGLIGFTEKNYAGMGYLIEEINGQKNNIKENMYWFFYVNGQSSQAGVSQYILKSNDVIEWKFEKSKF